MTYAHGQLAAGRTFMRRRRCSQLVNKVNPGVRVAVEWLTRSGIIGSLGAAMQTVISWRAYFTRGIFWGGAAGQVTFRAIISLQN